MRSLVESAYFEACRALGVALRSARYSTTEISANAASPQTKVLKSRRFYAPLLIGMGEPLMRLLGTGVRVLPQRDWEARERHLYRTLHGAGIETRPGGAVLLPKLPGRTLADLLEDPTCEEARQTEAVGLAVRALAELHAAGFTHGDAMAENLLVDLDGAAAHWFDFETVHDPHRPLAWRRADDLRALVATCWVRSEAERRIPTLRFVLDGYGDAKVVAVLADVFDSGLSRALPFHLAQAPMSFDDFQEIGRISREWVRAAG